MKSLFLYVLCCCTSIYSCFSQNISYSALTIPEEIRKNASVVKRYENIHFEVSDIEKATHKTHVVYTVLNKNGDQALWFHESSSKFRVLEDVDIKMYDAAGSLVKKYKKKDLYSVGISDGLIDDSKSFYLKLPAGAYPVTVEYIYEVRHKGTLFYPSYVIQNPGEAIEYSVFTAKVPIGLDLRYKEKNTKVPVKVSVEGNFKLYTWSVSNRSPYEFEDGAKNYVPVVYIAPNKFKWELEGDLSTWKSFGEWYNKLCTGMDELTIERKQFLQELVKDAKTDQEKVSTIYKYLQTNFRYVSIQLGIGGWKPFSADFTESKKYGDCKALSTYMKAALKAVGINSHLGIINRGYNLDPLDVDFPMSRTNHVLLCVPMKSDSIWLECTSKTTDFGVLGSDNENRTALLATDKGGVLVNTRKSLPADNKIEIKSVIELTPDGSGKTTSTLFTRGAYREIIGDILDAKNDDQKDFLVNSLDFKQPDDFLFRKSDDHEGLTTTLELIYEKIPDFTAGTKMFLKPRMYHLSAGKLPGTGNRKLDFYFSFPFEKVDTTVYKLPEGYVQDILPKSKQLQSEFAEYSVNYSYDPQQKTVTSTARLTLKQSRIPSAKFADAKKFFDEVLSDCAQRIVIKKE